MTSTRNRQEQGKRAVWVADASYLLKAAPDRFDYLKLKAVLEDEHGGPMDDGHYFNSTPNSPNDPQDAFHRWLKTAPPGGPKMRVNLFPLRELRTECSECGGITVRQIQKGVDVAIATTIIKLAAHDRCDRIILAAGDGDYVDAVRFARDECGKEVWVAGFADSISVDLQSHAGHVIWLDDYVDDIRRSARDW